MRDRKRLYQLRELRRRFRRTLVSNSDTAVPINLWRRSQWPISLRRGSAATRLLRLWVRIPPGAWMSVSCECCVLSGRALCDGLVIRPDESYRMWLRLNVISKPQRRGLGPLGMSSNEKGLINPTYNNLQRVDIRKLQGNALDLQTIHLVPLGRGLSFFLFFSMSSANLTWGFVEMRGLREIPQHSWSIQGQKYKMGMTVGKCEVPLWSWFHAPITP